MRSSAVFENIKTQSSSDRKQLKSVDTKEP